MYRICNRCSPVHGFYLAPQPLCAENSEQHSEYEAKAADQVNWMNSLPGKYLLRQQCLKYLTNVLKVWNSSIMLNPIVRRTQ